MKPEMRQCEKCGGEIGAEVAACPTCGAVDSPSTAPQPAAAKSRSYSLPPIAIAVCCGLAAVWLVYSFATRDSKAPVPGSTQTVDVSQIRTKAEGGDAEAQNSLGLLYTKGQGLEQNYTQAAKWYRLAADQGNAGAQASLGELYEAGQGGVPRNDTEAAKWYRLAAEKGSSRGQYNLAVLYVMGRGVNHDEAEALKWYLRAAEQGESLAQFNVGMRYYEGHAVPPDQVEAYFWLNLAADQGVADAVKIRDGLKRTMTPEQLAQARQRAEAFSKRLPKPEHLGDK
jgi:TPR repeat protein